MTGKQNATSLKSEVRALREEITQLKEARAIPEPLLTEKGHFFGLILAHALGSQGSRAFSDRYLESLENNAEKMWQAYVSIVRGDKILLAQERIAQERAKAEALAERLKGALATVEAQAATIRDLSTVDEVGDEPEPEATPEEAEKAAQEVEVPTAN